MIFYTPAGDTSCKATSEPEDSDCDVEKVADKINREEEVREHEVAYNHNTQPEMLTPSGSALRENAPLEKEFIGKGTWAAIYRARLDKFCPLTLKLLNSFSTLVTNKLT